jgi:hypothetical protein
MSAKEETDFLIMFTRPSASSYLPRLTYVSPKPNPCTQKGPHGKRWMARSVDRRVVLSKAGSRSPTEAKGVQIRAGFLAE